MIRFRLLCVAILVLALGATPASADGPSGSYAYLVATDFLCELDPSACPAVAMADNGDTIEISGAGTLDVAARSVSGSGTATHRDAAGNVIGMATWSATQLLSFKDYGSSTDPGFPAFFRAGTALIRVHVVAIGAPLEADAILQVTCELPGASVPGNRDEGVQLNVQGFDLNFNREVSGFTVFIAGSP